MTVEDENKEDKDSTKITNEGSLHFIEDQEEHIIYGDYVFKISNPKFKKLCRAYSIPIM